jgi:subtilisin family serine protease
MKRIVKVHPEYEPGDLAAELHMYGCNIIYLYHKLNSFCSDIDDDTLEILNNDSRVVEVLNVKPVNNIKQMMPTQANPPWNLDRIDQRALPLDNEYNWNYDGTGVKVYVLDSGILYSHDEFESRIVHGFGDTPWPEWWDHGTSVASLVGGATLGVAKGVTMVGVNMWRDTTWDTDTAYLTNAINWILADHEEGTPAAVTLAFNWGEEDAGATAAFEALVASGIVCCAAAGNSDNAVEDFPPQNVPGMFIIGGSNETDGRANSSWGPDVDIWCPGANLVVAADDGVGDSATTTVSGTSGSCGIIAGAFAQLAQERPDLTGSAAIAEMLARASTVAVDGTRSTDNFIYGYAELVEWGETTQFTGITQNQYQDDSVVPGEWYRYRVSGDGSDYTDWVQAQAPTAETGTGGSTVGVNVTTVQQGSKNASGGSVVSCDTTTVQAGSKQSTNAGTTTVDVTTVGAGDKQESTVGAGGSTTSVTVATVGTGQKASTGDSVVVTETSTLGQGLKGATGFNVVHTSIETVAVGSKATTSAGTTDIIITTVGTGTKQESTVGGGGSTVNVTAHTVGSGFKGGLGGDTTTVAIDLDGEGYKWVSGSTTTTVLVSPVGLGFNPETPISHRNITFELSEVDFKWIFGEVKQNTILSDVTLADDAIVVTSVYQTQLVFADAAVKMNVSEVSRRHYPDIKGVQTKLEIRPVRL